MNTRKILTIMLLCLAAFARADSPPPFEMTIDAQGQSAPAVTIYRASESAFRVRFVSNGSNVNVTGFTPFMTWAVTNTSTVRATSSWSYVSAVSGLVDFVFSATSCNYTQGRYMYEVGTIKSSGAPGVYRQGTWTILASPFGTATGTVNWASTNLVWGNINWSGLPSWILTTQIGDGLTWDGTNLHAKVYGVTDAVARAWALAASNLALSASQASTDATARAWAIAASNLAAAAGGASTDSTARAWAIAASNLAVTASNLAYAASLSSTDAVARAWAVAASNLAAAAVSASTDATARAWALAASNLAVTASNLAYSASLASTDAVARAQAVIASNLAYSASRASTDATARAWALAASNLALSASLASTDATARAWALAASNFAAAAHASNHWAAADSTTNYASRTAYQAFTSAYASALSTTGFAVRTVYEAFTSAYATANSTTNFMPFIAQNVSNAAMAVRLTGVETNLNVLNTNAVTKNGGAIISAPVTNTAQLWLSGATPLALYDSEYAEWRELDATDEGFLWDSVVMWDVSGNIPFARISSALVGESVRLGSLTLAMQQYGATVLTNGAMGTTNEWNYTGNASWGAASNITFAAGAGTATYIYTNNITVPGAWLLTYSHNGASATNYITNWVGGIVQGVATVTTVSATYSNWCYVRNQTLEMRGTPGDAVYVDNLTLRRDTNGDVRVANRLDAYQAYFATRPTAQGEKMAYSSEVAQVRTDLGTASNALNIALTNTAANNVTTSNRAEAAYTLADAAPTYAEASNSYVLATGESRAITLGGALTVKTQAVFGVSNTATGQYATITGGGFNSAAGPRCVIGGGFFNTNAGIYATIGGGFLNYVKGRSSVIPGGQQNVVDGDYGFAAGRLVKSTNNGAFVWGDSVAADKGQGGGDNSATFHASGGFYHIDGTNILASSDGALTMNGAAITSGTVVDTNLYLLQSVWSNGISTPPKLTGGTYIIDPTNGWRQWIHASGSVTMRGWNAFGRTNTAEAVLVHFKLAAGGTVVFDPANGLTCLSGAVTTEVPHKVMIEKPPAQTNLQYRISQ